MDAEEKVARISDILEQIEELNKLLDFLEINNADDSSIRQYEYMRRQFITELNQILLQFKLKVQSLELAA